MLAQRIGFPLPQGMQIKHVVMTGFIAGMGLTVALFVAGEAFEGLAQREAKMGALFSGLIAFAALGLGRMFKLKASIPDEVFDDPGSTKAADSMLDVDAIAASVDEKVKNAEAEREEDEILH